MTWFGVKGNSGHRNSIHDMLFLDVIDPGYLDTLWSYPWSCLPGEYGVPIEATQMRDYQNQAWWSTFPWTRNWCATTHVWGELCDPGNIGFNCSGLPHWNFDNRWAVVYIQKYRHLDVYIGAFKPEIVGMRAVNNIAGWKVYNGDPGMHACIHTCARTDGN